MGTIETLPQREVPDIIGARRTGYHVALPDPAGHVFGFPKEWAYLAAELAAHCMAVQAGLLHRNDETNGRPFCPRVRTISEVPTK